MDKATLFVGAIIMFIIGIVLINTSDEKVGTSWISMALGLMWMGVATNNQ